MATPKVCILRAPGTNCDHETAEAFRRAGAEPERVHVFDLLERGSGSDGLDGFQIFCIPGGFSYGDDIAAGAALGRRLTAELPELLGRFVDGGGLVLGICNGFQVLMQTGLLPGGTAALAADTPAKTTTLTWNDSGRYTARWVTLAAGDVDSPFLAGIDRLEVPIAHAEGRLATTADPSSLAVAFRYADSDATPTPANPNGSVDDIAGLCDPTGRVLGLMPHPERYIDATQHPTWTRRPKSERTTREGAGLQLFKNAVAAV